MHRKFNANTSGTDFIVGDIHGEFKDLEQFLCKIKFDAKKDRLFSVGDLTNRGRYSSEVFHWMNYDWFFPVAGNHEKMVVDVLRNPNSFFSHKFTTQLGKWLLDLKGSEKHKLIDYCESLPLLQTITLNNGNRAGVVHAHIPYSSWKETIENINNSQVQYYCQSTDDAMLVKDNEYIEDLEVLFVGHLIQKDIVKKANTLLIDTGSGYPKRKLSILDINTQQKVN